MLYTTLAKIRAHDPCEDGWRKLLKHLGKAKADDARLSLLAIYESNGPADCIWCLRAVDDAEVFARRFALDCARAVEHLNPDPRVKACNDTVERFLKGAATNEDLAAARDAARDAAWDAARAAARDAAWDAARAAARDAAWDAAWAAAWDAAWAAAVDAAWTAISKHFIACLKTWPEGEWPKMEKIGVAR